MLADLFDPASGVFLADQVSSPPTLAVDLGCGPGHSTRLLARVTRAIRIVGLDNSENFLAAARKDATNELVFLTHDVRNTPWSMTGADLAFARLVLPHLPEPAAVTMTWLAQLATGGMLALDELEWLHTDDPALDRYLEIATAVVAAHGGRCSPARYWPSSIPPRWADVRPAWCVSGRSRCAAPSARPLPLAR